MGPDEMLKSAAIIKIKTPLAMFEVHVSSLQT